MTSIPRPAAVCPHESLKKNQKVKCIRGFFLQSFPPSQSGVERDYSKTYLQTPRVGQNSNTGLDVTTDLCHCCCETSGLDHQKQRQEGSHFASYAVRMPTCCLIHVGCHGHMVNNADSAETIAQRREKAAEGDHPADVHRPKNGQNSHDVSTRDPSYLLGCTGQEKNSTHRPFFGSDGTRISPGIHGTTTFLLISVLLLLLLLLPTCTATSRAVLEVVYPYRKTLAFAPAWFGTMVLPPGRAMLEVQYAGDACESLLGRIPVRDKVMLVDRGKCSFLQKVCVLLHCSHCHVWCAKVFACVCVHVTMSVQRCLCCFMARLFVCDTCL
jgi:hypothetical protein